MLNRLCIFETLLCVKVFVVSHMALAQNEWRNLSNPPKYDCSVHGDVSISHLLPLNSSEILVIIKHLYLSHAVKEIWTYNISNDNYTKLIAEKNIPENIKFYTASLNDNKSCLYLFGESGKIISVNLKTKKFEQLTKTHDNGSHCHSFFIKEEFHIFGGLNTRDKFHYIWNENTKELNKFHFCENLADYLRSTNHVFLKINKSCIVHYLRSTKIFWFSILTNKCETIYWPQGVLSRNEQYIIVFSVLQNNIWICDLKLQKSWKSNIKTWKIDIKYTVIISDIKKEELLCFGYIRFLWKILQCEQILFPPFYLMKMIDAFFTIETIHIMNKDKHLCINIDKLLQM